MDEKRPRVFVVEDEPFVLMELESALIDLGYNVVGKARDLFQGLILAQKLDFDLAVLDVNLSGLTSAKIADLLEARGVPFLFMSGYTINGIPERHRKRRLIQKPFGSRSLSRALTELLSNIAPHPESPC